VIRWLSLSAGIGLSCLALSGSTGLPISAAPQTPRFVSTVRIEAPYTPTPDFEAFIGSLKEAVEGRASSFINDQVAQSFYYQRDFGGMFNSTLSGAENFNNIIVLDNERLADDYQDLGWHELEYFLNVSSFQQVDGDVCGPSNAVPSLEFPDDAYWFDWGYIDGAGVRVRTDPSDRGQVLTQVGYEVVEPTGEVLDDLDSFTNITWTQIVAPDGSRGFVDSRYFSRFGKARLCYTRTDGGWMIGGYIGGGD
jgi:hypothetical protein